MNLDSMFFAIDTKINLGELCYCIKLKNQSDFLVKSNKEILEVICKNYDKYGIYKVIIMGDYENQLEELTQLINMILDNNFLKIYLNENNVNNDLFSMIKNERFTIVKTLKNVSIAMCECISSNDILNIIVYSENDIKKASDINKELKCEVVLIPEMNIIDCADYIIKNRISNVKIGLKKNLIYSDIIKK